MRIIPASQRRARNETTDDSREDKDTDDGPHCGEEQQVEQEQQSAGEARGGCAQWTIREEREAVRLERTCGASHRAPPRRIMRNVLVK
jgi:hypothetical protein